jgi:1-aminocyclopropane-1-carboxylate deaminase/D-cysteine desulfhydrase-like pyridoxal-dependent ACC family enzyme
MVEALALFARTEALLLDPVYSGKAAAGLIAMVRRGDIRPSERVLFLHTGGTPALFAYGDGLLASPATTPASPT